jgi:hypothetical protein
MLTDFIAGLALIAVGGFLILAALPRRRSRRYRPRGEPQIRELRHKVRRFLTIVTIGAGLLVGGFGFVVLVVALAGIQIGLV